MINRIIQIVRAELGRTVLTSSQIHSGNSQVFKLHCDDGDLIAKIYPRSPQDPRNRLGTEFAALTFLNFHGLRSVPGTLYIDRKLNLGIYEFVSGTALSLEQHSRKNIDEAVNFLSDLAGLRDKRGCKSIRDASEACYSLQDYSTSIHRRLSTLEEMSEESHFHRAARAFLDVDLIPLFQALENQNTRNFDLSHVDASGEIPHALRTLSPSDFGFHNAIRKSDNSMVFVDFEYFGWDDPAQSISAKLKDRFLNRMLKVFHQDGELERRIQVVHPLLGIKWCLIMLNEFLPGPLERRRLANQSRSMDEMLETQLNKAQNKLNEVRFQIETKQTHWEFA